MQPVGHLFAAGRPFAERGVLRPVGLRLIAAAVLLVAELLSVYLVTLLADYASHKKPLWLLENTELSPVKLGIRIFRV